MDDARDPTEHMMSTRRVAEFFGLHIRTIYRWRDAGVIRMAQVEGRWYASGAEVTRVAHARRHRGEAAPDPPVVVALPSPPRWGAARWADAG
jgi:Helix-turn-helix domain